MTAKLLQKIGLSKSTNKKSGHSHIIAQHLYSLSVLNGYVCLNGEPLKNGDAEAQITANKIIEKMKEKDVESNFLPAHIFDKLKSRLKSHCDSDDEYPILVASLNGYELETNLWSGDVFYDCFFRKKDGSFRDYELNEKQLQELHNLLLKERYKQEEIKEEQARQDEADYAEAEDNRKHLGYEGDWLTHCSITLN